MEWIETSTGNRVSKKCKISGAAHILLAGNTTISSQCILEGDVTLANPDINNGTVLQVGQYSFLSTACSISPPLVGARKQQSSSIVKIYQPSIIGLHVIIGHGSRVKSSKIGDCVIIGYGCRLGNFSVIGNCTVIRPGCVIPDRMTIGPFSYIDTNNDGSLRVRELPHGFYDEIKAKAMQVFICGDIEDIEYDEFIL